MRWMQSHYSWLAVTAGNGMQVVTESKVMNIFSIIITEKQGTFFSKELLRVKGKRAFGHVNSACTGIKMVLFGLVFNQKIPFWCRSAPIFLKGKFVKGVYDRIKTRKNVEIPIYGMFFHFLIFFFILSAPYVKKK